jgi:hypothetical protein
MRRLSLALGLLVLGCGSPEEAVEDLGTLDDKRDEARAREVPLSLGPGEIRRFRIQATAFEARVAQDGEQPAQLSARHLDLEVVGAVSPRPVLLVDGDGSLRNWTVRVHNQGDDVLEGRLSLGPRAARELGVVSDIDKTVLPPETAAGLPDAYPGVAALYTALEGSAPGDTYYVTARAADGIEGLAGWMEEQGLPAGPIDTGISTLPWVSQPEKVSDIARIFDAHPDQRFALFGDTSHRDPEVYREILGRYPGRVAAVFIHKVNQTVSPDRVDGMHLVEHYAEAAAIGFGLRLLDEAAARDVMTRARDEGLEISAAEIDALLDAHRP